MVYLHINIADSSAHSVGFLELRVTLHAKFTHKDSALARLILYRATYSALTAQVSCVVRYIVTQTAQLHITIVLSA